MKGGKSKGFPLFYFSIFLYFSTNYKFMKKTILSLLAFFVLTASYGQKKSVDEMITKIITKTDAEAHLTFLAADEMRGRDTGSPEIDIAANYIASYFRQLGIKPAPGAEQYFQKVEFQKVTPASVIQLTVKDQVFKVKEDLSLFGGNDVDIAGEIVFVGYGKKEDFKSTDVKGKIVVALTGAAGENNVMKAFLSDSPEKYALAKEAGAAALIEIVSTPGIPWPNIAGFLGQERMSLKKEGGITHLWMKNSDHAVITALKETKKSTGSLKVAGTKIKYSFGKNVAAVIEGTDPKLKNEYLIISAHYDHVGVMNKPNETDSIYNGARDNAIGTVGLMETAKFLSMYPPKRSILFLALTGEEKGLLGSSWYVDHPLIPLKQCVFNFNCDGAGYNDKTIATIIGLERTTAQADLAKGCEAFGLKAALDPVPEQNLYERSDNFSFAVKGIPAIDFSPGVKAFDAELNKYYHQAADEVSSLDFDYLIKYFRAYVYTNYLLSNAPKAPSWKPGDKFEEAGKKLYAGN